MLLPSGPVRSVISGGIGALVGAAFDGALQGIPAARGEREFDLEEFLLITALGAVAGGVFIPFILRGIRESGHVAAKVVATTEPAAVKQAAKLAETALQRRLNACNRSLAALERVVQEGKGGEELGEIRGRVAGMRATLDRMKESPSDEGLTRFFREIRAREREIDDLVARPPAGATDLAAWAQARGGARRPDGVGIAGIVQKKISELPTGHPARIALEECREHLARIKARLSADGDFTAAETRLQTFHAGTTDKPGWRQAVEFLQARFKELREKAGKLGQRVEQVDVGGKKPSAAGSDLKRIKEEIGRLRSDVETTVSGLDARITEIRRMPREGVAEQLERLGREAAALRAANRPAAVPTTAAPSFVKSGFSLDIMAEDADLIGIARHVFSDLDSEMTFWRGPGGARMYAWWQQRQLTVRWDLGSFNPGVTTRVAVRNAFQDEGASAMGIAGGSPEFTLPYYANANNLHTLFRRLAHIL